MYIFPNEKKLKEYVQAFFSSYIFAHINRDLLPYIKDHHEKGHKIVLVTEVMEPLAKEFQKYLKAKGCISTLLEKKNRIYTGSIKQLCWKETKAIEATNYANQHHINLNKSYAYADSHHDIPLLEIVWHPMTVNPQPKLVVEAKKRDWTILF